MAKEPGELTEPELGGDLQKLLDGGAEGGWRGGAGAATRGAVRLGAGGRGGGGGGAADDDAARRRRRGPGRGHGGRLTAVGRGSGWDRGGTVEV